jgi:hypothetical protein
MRPRMTLVAVIAAALAAGVVTTHPAPRDPRPRTTGRLQLVASDNAGANSAGKPMLSNSLDGKPILTVVGLQPGQSRTGQLTVKNAGAAPETVTVWQSGLTSGPASRPNLAAWAQLAVYDAALNKTIYAGAYQNFPTLLSPLTVCGVPSGKVSCPSWAKGETHVFTFTVTFPDVPRGSATNINTYQSTWLQSEFDWASAI